MSRKHSAPDRNRRVLFAVLLLLTAGIVWAVVLSRRVSPERSLIDAGIEYARQKDGARAEAKWQEAVRVRPDSVEAWNYLAEYYLALHNWTAAMEALEQVQRLQPAAPQISARLADTALKAGDEQRAYRAAETALKQNPDDTATLWLFCNLLEKTGENQRRLDLLKHLNSLQPDRRETLLALAKMLVMKRLYAEAQPYAEAVLRQDAENLEALSLRGTVRFHTDTSPGGLQAAYTDFSRVVRTPRYAPFAHFYLGKIAARQEKWSEAVSHLETAAAALPDKSEVFFELANVCTQTGRPAQAAVARARFERIKKREKEKPSAPLHP